MCGVGVVEGGAGGAVVVAEDLGVFEEVVVVDHALEGGTVGEVVFAAVRLGAAWGAGGPGDGEIETFDQRAELGDQGGFTRA